MCLDCVGQLPGGFEQLQISPSVAGMHTCDLLAYGKGAVNCSDCAGAICWLCWLPCFAQVEQTSACRTAVVCMGCRSGMLLWLPKCAALVLQMKSTNITVFTCARYDAMSDTTALLALCCKGSTQQSQQQHTAARSMIRARCRQSQFQKLDIYVYSACDVARAHLLPRVLPYSSSTSKMATA